MTMRWVYAPDDRQAGPFTPVSGCFDRCPHRDTTVCEECLDIAGDFLVDVVGQWCLCGTREEAAAMRDELDAASAEAAAWRLTAALRPDGNDH